MKEYVKKFDILFQTVDEAPEPRQIYSTHLPHLIYKGEVATRSVDGGVLKML